MTTATAALHQRVDALGGDLVELSHRIHAHPELGFEEEQASSWCAEALASGGFEIDAGICDLPTAFVASAGSGPLEIGICCEYDALPDVGHACGHNIIAAAAVGAGLALAGLADELEITVKVLGTPAEEGGGGKILMLDGGAFDGLHAALMVHPWPTELLQMPCLAVSHFDVKMRGKEAHAAAFPELGVNAADALTVAQVGIGLLRQHASAGDQVHGIITYGGRGAKHRPGAGAEATYYVRAVTLAALTEWEARVRRCFDAGALATGAAVEIIQVCPPYSEFRVDASMAAIYQRNAEALGRTFIASSTKLIGASTDMANVSLAIPAIHPTLGLDSLPAVNHQAEFAAHCITAIADRVLLDGAKAMTGTVADLATDDEQRSRLQAASYRHG